ncbi:MAG: hypothetical protein JNL32_13825 [Candidatus Kapabacteria bacterium]|nr:hypothetical protein [Candidatus Kapabacteria bacterium]
MIRLNLNLLSLLCCMALAVPAVAQIDVAPTSMVITSDTRNGVMLLRNVSNEEREVEVNAFFAYPATDSAGTMYMEKLDSVTALQYSLIPHLRVFPRRLVLPPNAEQNIKFLVTPKGTLNNGTYWARFSIKSKPTAKPIERQMTGDSVAIAMQFIVERVSGVVYLNNTVNIGLEVGQPQARRDSMMRVFIPMEAKGNSPFWGNMNMTIKDAETDSVVAEHFELLAVYFSMNRRFDFALAKFSSGKRYIAELKIDSERTEIPEKVRKTFAAIEKRLEFIVP